MGNKEQKSEKKPVVATPPASGLLSLEDFDTVFDNFLSRKWPRLLDWNFPIALERGFPKVDILDRDNEIEVHAALPGIAKDNVEVTISGQSITIRASSSSEEKKTEDRYFHREITRGEFQRSLSLPENVDGDKAKASFKDGILKVVIPKIEDSKRKTIKVE